MLLTFASAGAHGDETLFAACDRALAADPTTYAAALCYFRQAAATGRWEIAQKRLAELATVHRDVHWLVLVGGYTTASIGDHNGAQAMYERAAAGFAATNENLGELLARANLRIMHFDAGRIAAAGAEVERIVTIGNASTSSEVRVRALVVEAHHLMTTKVNLGRAQIALTDARREFEPAHGYFLEKEIQNGLGHVATSFGEFRKAADLFAAFEATARAHDDLPGLSLAQTNRANALYELSRIQPDAVDFDALLAATEAALATAREAASPRPELLALRLMTEVLAHQNPERALAFAEQCVERAESLDLRWFHGQCLWMHAYLLAPTDMAKANSSMALALARTAQVPGAEVAQIAYGWRYLMRISWLTKEPADAVIDGLNALSVFESLRAAQGQGDVRSVVFSSWTRDYAWLAGSLLREPAVQQHGSDSRHLDRTALAFSIVERMRARSLYEALASSPSTESARAAELSHVQLRTAAPATPTSATTERIASRQAFEHEIAALNRRLIEAPKEQAAAIVQALGDIEKKAVSLRPTLDAIRTEPADLAAVRANLASDEAMLSFQTGLHSSPHEYSASGSWLIAITQAGARAYPIPDRQQLRRMRDLYLGRVSNASTDDLTTIGHAIYNKLLAAAIADLPETIARLIVIPDGPLHSLPFGSLSQTQNGQMLVDAFNVAYLPSASIWLRWRRAAAAAQPGRALVLASPATANSGLRVWRDGQVFELDDLPGARSEGENILDRLPESTVWNGPASSESALKSVLRNTTSAASTNTADPPHSILHFAAHAVIDNTEPHRSAIVLSAGAATEDGLLQPREISELSLDGRMVVLSSCDSALGTDVAGEGVFGLARAFFVAGSHSVIATLWPVRDVDAEAFFDRFYRQVAAGQDVGSAFHAAQRELLDQGAPVEAWAGFVLMGNADYAFDIEPPNRWPYAAIIALAVILLGIALRAVRRQV